MPSTAFTPIDLYCERVDPGFWAEPLNAVTNGAFVLAAWLAWRLTRAQPGRTPWATWALIAMLATIGVGSFLFHTLAVTWAMWADVIPIFLYQLLFLVLYTRRVMRLSVPACGAWVLAFFAASWGFGALPVRWLNGSLSYGSAFVFLAALAVIHWRHPGGPTLQRRREPAALALATGLFALSLTFRSLDMAACSWLSVGTHPLWHLLNAGVLYLSTRALVLNERRPGQP